MTSRHFSAKELVEQVEGFEGRQRDFVAGLKELCGKHNVSLRIVTTLEDGDSIAVVNELDEGLEFDEEYQLVMRYEYLDAGTASRVIGEVEFMEL